MKVLNLLTACAIAAPLLFVSCNSDDIITAPDSDADGVRISFSLGVTAGPADVASRAADGELYDKGLDGENKVNNAMVVIYDRPINSADGGNVLKVFYIENPGPFEPSTDTKEATYFDPTPSYYPQTDVLNKIEVGKTHLSVACTQNITIRDDSPLEVGKRYYAIALCNFGDMSKTFEKMSLSKFRDYVYTGALYDKNEDANEKERIRKYTNFRMTGINEESFIWERKTSGEFQMGQYLVQRLAARVDVSFGEAGTEFQNQTTYTDNGYIQLAVYTKADENAVYGISDTYSFYLTDLRIVNAVDLSEAKNSGTYLIERSSPFSPSFKDDNNNSPKPVYLDNEAWSSFNTELRKPTKYIFSPPGKSYKPEYSLASDARYIFNNDVSKPDVCGLVKGGNFYNDANAANLYHANKRNSSLVGYIPENTSENTGNRTFLRIEGYTKAPTSGSFTGSRASEGFDPANPTANGFKRVVGDIYFMHNTDKNSSVMDYAVVRNTIYRLSIKVLATENKISFRYYYCMPGADSQRPYEATAFLKDVGENSGDDKNIND